MDGIILLSEINPQGLPTFNPLQQAHKWYDLLTPEDIRFLGVNQLAFPAAIELIARRAEERNSVLVIRDWSHLDFIGVPYVPNPSCRLTLAEALRDSFGLIQASMVRHPIDMWLSLRRMPTMKDRISTEQFLRAYLRFAECGLGTGFVRYEDIVADPDRHLHELCKRLDIRFDPGYRERWHRYDRITGDAIRRNRGGDTIQPLPRRDCETGLLDEFAASKDYQDAIRLLGYRHPE